MLLLWLAVVVICVVAINWIGGSVVSSMTHDPEWPGGLGKLSDVPKRYPVVKDSAGATKLVQLASAAGIQMRRDPDQDGSEDGWDEIRKVMEEYIRTQLERSGDAIDAPPAELAQWLAKYAGALDAVRDHLRSEPVVWGSDVANLRAYPGPHLRRHNHLNRVLIARALLLARQGNRAAWDDLHAAHALNRALWIRPSSSSTRAALSASRLINGAMRKMPVPAPEWSQEFHRFDFEAAFWRGHQAGAWHERYGDEEVVGRVVGARQVEGSRAIAAAMMLNNVCDTVSPGFQPVLDKLGWRRGSEQVMAEWQTLVRFRAEREATQRILQLRSGQTPERASRCGDGAWEVTPASIRFTRDVKVLPPAVNIPLEYTLAMP